MKKLCSFETNLIDDVWRCVEAKNCIERDVGAMGDEERQRLSHLLRVIESLCKLNKFDDPAEVLDKAHLSSQNREYILNVWNDRNKAMDKKDWSIDVILGNSRIRKSLHAGIRMRIGDQNVEMNAEKFAVLRYEISHALQRMESYL